jgi:carbonic anhydrase
MNGIKPLPTYLVTRYHGWKATQFAENKAWYRRLAEDGQHPRAMVISCCDSRVHVTSIFGAETGEFFIHRNIANLVPPHSPDGDHHGTSAAIEYAVTALKVAHIIVMGHSSCGGVAGFHQMSTGRAPELEEKTSYIGRWLEILNPGFERVKDISGDSEQVSALEREGVVVALENLLTFPFVAERVAAEKLTLHGLWHDIAGGGVEAYDSDAREFVAI